MNCSLSSSVANFNVCLLYIHVLCAYIYDLKNPNRPTLNTTAYTLLVWCCSRFSLCNMHSFWCSALADFLCHERHKLWVGSTIAFGPNQLTLMQFPDEAMCGYVSSRQFSHPWYLGGTGSFSKIHPFVLFSFSNEHISIRALQLLINFNQNGMLCDNGG